MTYNNCFECKRHITENTVKVTVNSKIVEFHPGCARKILANYVVDINQREEDLERRAAEQDKSAKLSDKLGFNPNPLFFLD